MPPPVSLSPASDNSRMELALSDIRYLFEGPPIDALAGSHLGQSGVEAILQRLKRQRLPHGTVMELRVRAPAAQIEPGTEAHLQQLLADHAAARISAEQDDLVLLKREMRQSLKVGGLFLAACLLLATLVDRMTGLPSLLQDLLRESLVIAGWVGIWHPLDLILYAWWPNRYRIGLLNHVKGARLHLEPA